MGTISYAVEPPIVKVNCDDVKISTMTIGKNDFRFYAYWNEPTQFPNPPVSKKVGRISNIEIKPFKFTCPNFSASFNGNIAEIKSENYQAVLEHLGKYDRTLDLYHYSFYRYPNIREGLITVDYSIDLESFVFKTGIYTAHDGDDLNNSIHTSAVPKTSIIGYKVDGSELKPFLYDRKISNYKEDFDKANIIDIYHKMPSDDFRIGANIERIYIDKQNGILRIYLNSKFPSN
jgi:hypothetical protein